ncbi:EamA family transporter [Candidatus Bathyarchaeota archaeon]|nr:EamA family transporter [Candidatus Bathyarchaeota archaeon]
MEPLSAATLSAVLLGEKLENLQVIGIVLALMGVILIFQLRRKHN